MITEEEIEFRCDVEDETDRNEMVHNKYTVAKIYAKICCRISCKLNNTFVVNIHAYVRIVFNMKVINVPYRKYTSQLIP